MATVACPGCGLPRVESELGTKPCPVCDAPPATGTARTPSAKKHDPDPTAGLPADVSELYAPGAPAPTRVRKRSPEGGSRLIFGAVAFLLGTLCGVAGVIGVQSIDWRQAKTDEPEVAAKPADDAGAAPVPAPVVPQPPAIAPMPHEGGVKPIVVETEPDPELGPEVKQIKPPLPGHVETHEFNEPKDIYSVPVLKKGEHVVLKGKVKKLHVHALDAGAVLDASQLEVSIVTVTGRIDNGSKLKLRAPNGTVQISSKIDGKSEVTIDASGGEVKFTAQTTARNDGSKIDNGSTVAITARVVEFKGDISGTDTKVSILLSRNAWLKVASVSGKATVEYKSQAAGWSPPTVLVGPIAPTAVFRLIE